METGLALLAQAHMPLHRWWDTFHMGTYLINWMSSPIIKNQSSFQVLKGQSPDYTLLRTFGATCYPCLRPYQNRKFDFHTEKCVFIGFSDYYKGYRCLSPSGKIFISRHVCFKWTRVSLTLFHSQQAEPPTTSTTILSWLPFVNKIDIQPTVKRPTNLCPLPTASQSYSPISPQSLMVTTPSPISSLPTTTTFNSSLVQISSPYTPSNLIQPHSHQWSPYDYTS